MKKKTTKKLFRRSAKFSKLTKTLYSEIDTTILKPITTKCQKRKFVYFTVTEIIRRTPLRPLRYQKGLNRARFLPENKQH